MENDTSLSKALLTYGTTIPETPIPFMENYYQELMFILAPKSDYKPNMDPVENSNALIGNAKTKIGWEQEEFNLKKLVALRIDSAYLVILRIYGRPKDGDKSSTKQGDYVTIDCVQKRLNTQSWRCLNGDMIHVKYVCDNQNHCSDLSDETPSLCTGGDNAFFEGISHFTIAILILGFVSYLCAFVLSSIAGIVSDESGASKDIYFSDETKESFKAMREACTTIVSDTEQNDEGDGGDKMTSENVNGLKSIYRKYHDKGPAHKMVFLETIHDFSMHPLYDKPCSNLVDSIANEEEKIHQNDLKRPNSVLHTRPICLEKLLKLNFEVATYYFNVFERNDFFSRVNRKILRIPKSIFGKRFQDVAFYVSVVTAIGVSVKNIVSQYFDMVFDLKMFTSLQHVAENFIGDKEKLFRISSLPLHEMSYAYLLFGLLSHLGYYIIYTIDFKYIYKMKNSMTQKIVLAYPFASRCIL